MKQNVTEADGIHQKTPLNPVRLDGVHNPWQRQQEQIIDQW